MARNNAGRFISLDPPDNLVDDGLEGPASRPSQCAFPDDEDPPVLARKCDLGVAIALHIPLNFIAPEVLPRGRPLEHRAVMVVPETPVHEHDGTEPGKHQVGTSRKVAAVKSEAQAARMQATAQQHFRLGITAADAAHIEPPLFGSENVGHGSRHCIGSDRAQRATDFGYRLTTAYANNS
jgi:hypothetical protein